jgi:hypothetical protein
MNHSTLATRATRQRRGAVLPLIAIMLPVLLVLSGIAINIAYMQLTATELQISTDVAAKAAGGTYTRTLDKSLALNAAIAAGKLNRVAGVDQEFSDSDLVVGSSVYDPQTESYIFFPNQGNNSLQVAGRRDSGSLSGKVTTFFPKLVGVEDFSLTTAAVSTRIDVDIALVIDRSGSMAYNETEPAVFPPGPELAPADWTFGDPIPPSSRWEAAYEGVDEFLRELETSALNEQVSLVTYSTFGTLEQPLITNFPLILHDLDLYFNSFDGGGTNISSGLSAATSALSGPEAREFAAKVIVLMTDGKITVGSDPTGFVESQAEKGVMTVTISFSNEADIPLMKRLAAAGKGIHIHATTKADLKNAFREVVRRLPTILTQ